VIAGFLVALVLSPEHKALASTALKMARPFIRNIVDRLHVVLVMSGADAQRGGSSSASSQEVIKQLMAELVDKELEFNGQVTREIVTRSDPSGGTLIESLKQLLLDHAANIVVVSWSGCVVVN
jgi:nucleotide-binding universal stress UspA family protein